MTSGWSTTARYFALSLILLAVALVAWYAREMIKPLIMAGVIAYLLYPVVEFLSKKLRIRRKIVANSVFFLSLAFGISLPAVFLPVLLKDIQIVARDLLKTLDEVGVYLDQPILFGEIEIHLEMLVPAIKDSITAFLAPLPADAWRLIESTSKGALWFLVIVVGAYYFMTEWDKVRDWLINLAPDEYRLDMRRLYLEIKEVWMAYLRGQLTLMIIVGITFSVVWSIIGLPGALILGILGGVLSLIPDVGPFVATGLAFLVAILEGSTWLPISNFWFAMLVAGLYSVLINIKNIWLRPLIFGRSVHLNEGLVFVVIIAAVIFSGILGAFIIVPVLASAGVVVGYMRRRILGLPPFPPLDERSIKIGTEDKINTKVSPAKKRRKGSGG
ncbi:MAG: AI-2E family transporter [Chloroflexota bacterium]